ncbi:hypothetical protein JTB14_004643 [Gonioctena quinquepunctata]|nr:hypothetical protein JTB14_004643 [Gonioctena quinquepunctata]
MSLSSVALFFSVAFLATSATPLNDTSVGATCTITRFSQVDGVVNSCTNIVVQNLVVNAGQTLKLILKAGSTVTFVGTTSFAYAEWRGPLIWIKGDKINVIGASGHRLEGRGHLWWDGTGDSGKIKPQFMFIQATGGSTMKNINMYDCPHQCVAISDSNGLNIFNWQIDSSAGNPVNGKEVGHNTDGFDIAKSSNINIDSVVVRNQDDCVCINDGTNLKFSNLWCYGGHGLSVSAGISSDYNRNVVRNVLFENSHVIDSRNGIHIKSVADGGKGLMADMTFNNIQLSGISNYAINVEQNYRNNGGPSGDPNNNVPIEGLTVNGLTGTMSGPYTVPVYILCASGACSNFRWGNINIQEKIEKVEPSTQTLYKALTSEVSDIKEEVQTLQEENKQLKNQLEKVQKRQRHNNLVFYGIEGESTGTQYSLIENIVKISRKKSEVELKENDINDIFRLGEKSGHKRPVLIST